MKTKTAQPDKQTPHEITTQEPSVVTPKQSGPPEPAQSHAGSTAKKWSVSGTKPSVPLPPEVPRAPRSYLVFEDKDPFPFDPPRDFMAGDRLSFNLFTRNKGPNELQGVIDALWLYVKKDYEYSTQVGLLADFKRRIRDSSSARPPIPRSLEPGDGHFFTAFAWDETNNPIYLQQPDLDALHAGTKICFVVVQISYNDNGVTHHLRRCEWLQRPASHPGIWHFCQDFASD